MRKEKNASTEGDSNLQGSDSWKKKTPIGEDQVSLGLGAGAPKPGEDGRLIYKQWTTDSTLPGLAHGRAPPKGLIATMPGPTVRQDWACHDMALCDALLRCALLRQDIAYFALLQAALLSRIRACWTALYRALLHIAVNYHGRLNNTAVQCSAEQCRPAQCTAPQRVSIKNLRCRD